MNLFELDFELFHAINALWTHPFLDFVLPFWRNKYLWIPLYLYLFTFLLLNFKRKGLWVALWLALTVIVSDFVSSSVVKPLVRRERPCNDPAVQPYVRSLVPCGAGKSFTSSHATNHFAIAVFLGILFGYKRRWVWGIALFWAASISYGQVYVGVHYPLDIIGGALLGTSLAALMAHFCRRWVDLHTVLNA